MDKVIKLSNKIMDLLEKADPDANTAARALSGILTALVVEQRGDHDPVAASLAIAEQFQRHADTFRSEIPARNYELSH